jgi:hypothetical protein
LIFGIHEGPYVNTIPRTNNTASTSANIIEAAANFRHKATDARVGLPLPLNASLVAATKAKGVLNERKAAKKLFEAQSSIRIDVMLFKLSMAQKMINLLSVRVSKTFDSTHPVSAAISTLMGSACQDFARDFPLACRELTRYESLEPYFCGY